MKSIKYLIIACFALNISCGTAQQKKEFDPEYVKVTNERAQKIVDEMDLESSEKQRMVRDLIAEQYRNLSWIHDGRDAKIEEIKKSNLSEEEQQKQIKTLEERAEKEINNLHKKYVKSLNSSLTEEQVDAVKDGMTYSVVPKTYAAFQEMLPDLTEDQKKYIYDNLVEAREHAMDAGSSHKKHWWFGKYKGRINNYLSAEGYDLAKAGEEWQKRIKEREAKDNN